MALPVQPSILEIVSRPLARPFRNRVHKIVHCKYSFFPNDPVSCSDGSSGKGLSTVSCVPDLNRVRDSIKPDFVDARHSTDSSRGNVQFSSLNLTVTSVIKRLALTGKFLQDDLSQLSSCATGTVDLAGMMPLMNVCVVVSHCAH